MVQKQAEGPTTESATPEETKVEQQQQQQQQSPKPKETSSNGKPNNKTKKQSSPGNDEPETPPSGVSLPTSEEAKAREADRNAQKLLEVYLLSVSLLSFSYLFLFFSCVVFRRKKEKKRNNQRKVVKHKLKARNKLK
jgi:hypothetical protein